MSTSSYDNLQCTRCGKKDSQRFYQHHLHGILCQDCCILTAGTPKITHLNTPKLTTPATLMDLSDSERLALARILKHYFPWLGCDDYEVEGSDTISELAELYSALPQIDNDAALAWEDEHQLIQP